jgi:hypothetical protein
MDLSNLLYRTRDAFGFVSITEKVDKYKSEIKTADRSLERDQMSKQKRYESEKKMLEKAFAKGEQNTLKEYLDRTARSKISLEQTMGARGKLGNCLLMLDNCKNQNSLAKTTREMTRMIHQMNMEMPTQALMRMASIMELECTYHF